MSNQYAERDPRMLDKAGNYYVRTTKNFMESFKKVQS